MPIPGQRSVTAVVKAAAEAAWEEGKEEERTRSGNARRAGTSAARGRERCTSVLMVCVATVLNATAPNPCAAACLGAPLRVAANAAIPIHRPPPRAAVVNHTTARAGGRRGSHGANATVALSTRCAGSGCTRLLPPAPDGRRLHRRYAPDGQTPNGRAVARSRIRPS